MLRLRRSALSLALVPILGLSACDDGPSGTRLTADQVADAYQVCALTFTPEGGTLPAVDIRTAAFELQNADVSKPRLAVNADRTFTLEYTAKGQFSTVIQKGGYSLGRETITATFNNPTEVNTRLLLPSQMTLNFAATPKALTATSTTSYNVPRADYARLRGSDQTNLPMQISGSLSASFQKASCS